MKKSSSKTVQQEAVLLFYKDGSNHAQVLEPVPVIKSSGMDPVYMEFRRKAIFVLELVNEYKAKGLDLTVFSIPLDELLDAIADDEIISDIIDQKIDIANAVQNPKFRFCTLNGDEVKKSLKISKALSKSIQKAKSLSGANASKKAAKRRKENADEFAERIYPEIERLKRDYKVKSFRATAEMLNEQKIETFRGGKWHVKTLQDIYDRCKDLGIMETKDTNKVRDTPRA